MKSYLYLLSSLFVIALALCAPVLNAEPYLGGVCVDTRLETLENAASTGDPVAQNNFGSYLATYCDHSECVRCTESLRDTYTRKAFEWYRRAAEQGVPPAQYNLALMYEQGRGITKDEAKAMRWYLRAAQLGFAPAVEKMGKDFVPNPPPAEPARLCLSGVCIGMTISELLKLDLDLEHGVYTNEPVAGAGFGLAAFLGIISMDDAIHMAREEQVAERVELAKQPPTQVIVSRLASGNLCEEDDIHVFFRSPSGHRTGVLLRYLDKAEPLRVVLLYRRYDGLKAGAADNLIDNIITTFPGHVVPVNPTRSERQAIYITTIGDEKLDLEMQHIGYAQMGGEERRKAYTDRKACLEMAPPPIE